jgi:hypothetical protein
LEIECEAVARIDSLAPSRRPLDEQGWQQVAEPCLLLASFERATRSRDAIHDGEIVYGISA